MGAEGLKKLQDSAERFAEPSACVVSEVNLSVSGIKGPWGLAKSHKRRPDTICPLLLFKMRSLLWFLSFKMPHFASFELNLTSNCLVLSVLFVSVQAGHIPEAPCLSARPLRALPARGKPCSSQSDCQSDWMGTVPTYSLLLVLCPPGLLRRADQPWMHGM